MDKEYYRHYRRTEDEHWWFRGRRRIVAEVVSSLQLPPDAAILEVGCGTGGNLAVLSRFGKLSAMEMDDEARHMAEDRGVVEVRSGRLPDDIPFEEQYDLIVALDVIEHIEDDLAALASLVTKLAPGGRLVVTVPAFMLLWGEHDEINHHFRRYRRAELARRLGQAGLTVHHITYFNSLLFPLAAAGRLMERLRPPSAERPRHGDLALPGHTVNRVLEAVFAAERRVVPTRRLPAGVSLLAVTSRAHDTAAPSRMRARPSPVSTSNPSSPNTSSPSASSPKSFT